MALVMENDKGREREKEERRARRDSRASREVETEKDGRRERKDSRSSRKEKEKERDEEKEARRERRDSHRDRERDDDRKHRKDSKRDKGKGRESDKHTDDERDKKESRVAAYTPEFLHSLANSPTKAEFDVISGADAVRFTRRFVREQAASGAPVPAALAAAGAGTSPPHAPPTAPSNTPARADSKPEKIDRIWNSKKPEEAHDNRLKRCLPPVVFALPRSAAGDAGRRVVDFYMSWRGKTKTTPLKGRSRRAGFLDAEFRRVREALDGEWRRASRVIKGIGGACAGDDVDWEREGPVRLARAPTDPQPLPRLPPLLAQYAREEKDGDGGVSAPPAARSVSDPLPHSSAHAYPLPSSFPINMERPPLGTHRGSIDSLNSVTSLPLLGMVRGVPVGNRVPLRVTNPGDRMSMSSSSGSIVELPKARPLPRGSPLRDGGVAFDVPPSQYSKSATTHTLQFPGRTASDSSNASSSGSSRKSKSRKEKMPRVERVGDDEQEKILIVLLDEKDRDNLGEKMDKLGDDATWHGLERRLSQRSARKPSPPGSTQDSPWLGPLVNLDEDITYIHTPDHSDYYSDAESDDDNDSDWSMHGAGAVVPIKSLLSAMGYLAPEAAVMGGTPSPYGSYAALPAPYNSPYVNAGAAALAGYSSPYVSPQAQGSPYQVPLPPSRPHTPVGYGTTPPMGQRVPSWASPNMGYPPTAYTSPAPAGYASPYANASPGGGYANLAAGYSSPYVSPLQGAGRGASGFY
ncbi:hypothetical protein B0H13DRAFT_1991035 [Mycena leptocephala]|nr:hypothetical protein B0H13DRAFT_1991035 [Mycena leptocephala]